MIVISGALVLVALVLLVLGLTMTDLEFVYGSIAVSLVSFVFLVIGILQRRGEQPAPGAAEISSDTAADDRTAALAVPTGAAKTGSPGPVPVVDDELDEGEPGGGIVLVVPGRPRYHVDGCRYLTGKDADEIDVLDARDDGFTPCGVCKPDAVLEELAAAEMFDEQVDEGEFEDEPVDEIPEPEPVAPARKAPAKKASSTRATSAVAPEAAPTAPTRRGAKVVVIPERGRFHTPDCRFVRDALDTEELTKTQATRQGYRPCGVCRP